jgi:hypothetical protein
LASAGLIAPVARHRSFHPNELFVQFSIDKIPLIFPFMLLSQNCALRDEILPLRNVTGIVIMRPDWHVIPSGNLKNCQQTQHKHAHISLKEANLNSPHKS